MVEMVNDNPGVGTEAPNFQLPEASEDIISLKEELKKGIVVLIFYPSDFGMMCAVELIVFRDRLKQFQDAGGRLLAICTNSTFCHRAFKEHLRLPFPILSDFDGKVSSMFGVLAGEEGYLRGRSERAVIVIDPKGIIRFKWMAPDAAMEPDYDELLSLLRTIREERS
jgi:peroxiredoxin